VKLMYAEELCFAPKYVRAKELADEGALGEVYLVRQSEQHFGPHSDWFWDPELAGGGVLMDMGCHGIEFARWVYAKRPAASVSAEVGTFCPLQAHKRRRSCNRHHPVREPAGGPDRSQLGQAGRRRRQGGDPRLAGSDLRRLDARLVADDIQRGGYGYAMEKAPDTRGWTFTVADELWNSGFP
jgi:GFO/IDH/MocA C-terminal domain